MTDQEPTSLLTEAQAARLLNFTPRFLQARRARGDGPPWVSISARAIRYRRSDLLEWIESHVRASAADRRTDAL